MEIDSAKKYKFVELVKLSKFLEIDFEKILEKYDKTSFIETSIVKGPFFRGLVNGSMSDQDSVIVAQKCALSFHKDMRSSINYAIELCIAWLLEDLILEKLKTLGATIELDGKDQGRDFLSKYSISVHPDFIYKSQSKSIAVELVTSWDDYWMKNDVLDLRSSKYEKLVNTSSETFILAIDVLRREGMFLSAAEIRSNSVKRVNPAWGNKLVYSYSGINKNRNSLDVTLHQLLST
jgi:hypothetical protein